MNKIIRYIDCDGVILDTETGLFDEYNKLKENGSNIRKTEYLQQLNWQEWIKQAKIINNSIDILKEHDENDTVILTKIHSLVEGSAKIEYFRELGIKNNIILVPNSLNKTDIVEAKYHILVDDSLKNLDDWYLHDGIPILFNQTINQDSDSFEEYPQITTLEPIFSKEYIKRLKK